MTDNVIELDAVRKHFGPVCAVDGVDLHIRTGEVFGLIGHNGAGKTTLFKLMLGLTPATAGEIRISGHPVRGETFRQLRRGIGYLPESLALYDNLTGAENLRFFARLKGASVSACPRLLERVGLAGAAEQRVRGYSKGMRQRLGFAQALLGSPQLLFLDEPTNGLDPQGILEFYAIVNELRAKGVTLVLSSHLLAEIQQRVDRLALMRNGRIQTLGTVAALRDALQLPLGIRVTIAEGKLAEVQRVLAGLGMPQMALQGPYGRLECARSRKMAVLAALTGVGPAVLDIEVQEPSLEAVFLGYANQALEDSP